MVSATATTSITLTAKELLEKIYFSIDADNKAKFQIDSKFSMFKILLVTPIQVELAAAKSTTSKRLCTAREVTEDDLFETSSTAHYNIRLFPKASLQSNLSSVGGNATTDSSVLKTHCVGAIVGAEYIKNIQSSRPYLF